MADWETRLKNSDIPEPPKSGWENRLRVADMSPPPNPAEGGGTLQFGPFDTGLKIGENTQNFLAGTGKSMSDLAKGIGQKLGLYSFDDAAQTAKRDAPLMDTKSGTVGNVTGSVATMLPAAFIPGANTMAGAALIGAGTGLAQPAASAGEMVANTGIGAAAGPVGNMAGRALSAGTGFVRSTLEPFFAGGQKRIADDILRQFTPDSRTALANLLRDPGELVPGSLPNAAEAAQTPGIAQLVKQLRQMSGSQGQADFLARDQANNAARVAAVRTVAGDSGQRAFYDADREATANQLYSAARAKGIDPAALTPEALQNIAQFQQRVPPEVIAQAQKLAKISGTSMTDATSLDGMHWTKKALDGLIAKEAGPAGDSSLLRAYMGLKSDLLSGMDSLSPDYMAARKVYADMSKPINQMDVGQALSDKLIPALNDFGGNGNLRAAGFAEAMRHGDATTQRVLGMPRATMADVLEPAQMSTLNALGQDVARTANVKNLASASGSDTVQNAMSQNIINQTLGPLGLPASLGGNALLQSMLRPVQYAAKLGEGRITDRLAQMLLSPQETAMSLTRAEQPRIGEKLAQELIKYGSPAAAGAATAIPRMDYQTYMRLFNAAPDTDTKAALGRQYEESLRANLPQQ